MIYVEQGQDRSVLKFVHRIVKTHSSATKDIGPFILSWEKMECRKWNHYFSKVSLPLCLFSGSSEDTGFLHFSNSESGLFPEGDKTAKGHKDSLDCRTLTAGRFEMRSWSTFPLTELKCKNTNVLNMCWYNVSCHALETYTLHKMYTQYSKKSSTVFYRPLYKYLNLLTLI